MNHTQIQLFLAQVEVPLVDEEIKAVTQAISDYFRWDGGSFIEAVDAAFAAAIDAGRGDEVYSLWQTARELAGAALPEGTDPEVAKDVDSLVGAKALQVATADLAKSGILIDGVDDDQCYTVGHAAFLDLPWNAVFGFTTE